MYFLVAAVAPRPELLFVLLFLDNKWVEADAINNDDGDLCSSSS